MRDARRRLEKIEQQVDAILGPPPPTPEEAAAAAAEWNAMVERWASRLLATMDLEQHFWIVQHWTSHLLRQCEVKPCHVVPPGVMDCLWTLWSWKRDETKPIALPPEVVEVYLTNDRLNTRPHLDCEACGYPLPISFFFMQSQQITYFEQCPLCGCRTIGWHAYDIAHGNEGYQNLKPYSQR